MALLLFTLSKRANALNHGACLFFREFGFKRGHKLALSIFYRVGNLRVSVRLLPLRLGEIGLSFVSPIRQPGAIFTMAYRALTVVQGDTIRRGITHYLRRYFISPRGYPFVQQRK